MIRSISMAMPQVDEILPTGSRKFIMDELRDYICVIEARGSPGIIISYISGNNVTRITTDLIYKYGAIKLSYFESTHLAAHEQMLEAALARQDPALCAKEPGYISTKKLLKFCHMITKSEAGIYEFSNHALNSQHYTTDYGAAK